jgi:hypothetical protein
MERDDFPSLKKERLARLTLSFVMTLDHTHLQERDLSLIFSDTSHGNLTLTGVDLATFPHMAWITAPATFGHSE